MKFPVPWPRHLPTLLFPILGSLAGCTSVSQAPPAAPAEPPAAAASPKPVKADRLLVEKSKRLLTVYSNKKLVASYHVSLGRNPVGPKTCAGDNRTPEGIYTVTGKNPKSRYYRSLRLSYPNGRDKARAMDKGCPPGDNIVIHGLENGFGWVGRTHRDADWTNGCVAVTNEEMDALWTMVPVGTLVEIRP